MKYLKLVLFLTFCNSYAQVGIGNNTPQSSLHIESSSSVVPTVTNGILIPRIKNFPQTNPTRIGQLVFLQDNATIVNGFYYWNGTKWVGFPGSVDKEVDETIFSFEGQGYTGTALSRTMNFTKFVKANKDNFSVAANEITVGKSGLYLLSLTANSKKPSGSQDQANFTYSVLVNDSSVSSVTTSIAAEQTSSTSASLDFLYRLDAGQKIKATVTKSDQGPNNYVSFGINNLTLFFIQD